MLIDSGLFSEKTFIIFAGWCRYGVFDRLWNSLNKPDFRECRRIRFCGGCRCPAPACRTAASLSRAWVDPRSHRRCRFVSFAVCFDGFLLRRSGLAGDLNILLLSSLPIALAFFFRALCHGSHHAGLYVFFAALGGSFPGLRRPCRHFRLRRGLQCAVSVRSGLAFVCPPSLPVPHQAGFHSLRCSPRALEHEANGHPDPMADRVPWRYFSSFSCCPPSYSTALTGAVRQHLRLFRGAGALPCAFGPSRLLHGAFAVSFSFKLQAVFILPVCLVLLFTRRVRFRQLFMFPLMYLWIICLPFCWENHLWTRS